MLHAVLDTNVLVSGFAGTRIAGSASGDLIKQWRSGTFELLCSEPILDEVTRTLAKPYFHKRISASQAAHLVVLLRRRGRMVAISREVIGVATHPEDDLILATALSGKADYLVTGDAQLRRLGEFEGVQIVVPRAFQEVLARNRE